MTHGSDPYGLQQPGSNPDPLSAARGLPGVGYPAYDPITGQPLTSGAPPAGYPYQPPPGYPAAPPVYPVAGQLPPAHPAQYPPGYPYPGGYPQGVQMVPIYGGYPMVPAKPSRPGAATAAAVLAFVQSGFVLIGGISLLSGASEFGSSFRYGSLSSEFTVVAIITLIAGGLLIGGGATLLSRKSVWITAGCLVSLGVSVYWVVRISGVPYASLGLWAPILFAVLPIIALSLTMGRDVRAWIRAR